MPKSKGSYNIQAAAQTLQQRPVLKSGELECLVHPLGREQLDYIVKKSALAIEIFDDVARILDLDVEQDYFGLRLSRKDEANSGEQGVWLDLNRTLGDQTSGKHIQLVFGVQYYPAHPERLIDEYTRYLFFLQLRKDLFEGRLKCTPDAQTRLMAFVAQSVLGNYDAAVHKHGYVRDLPQLPRMTDENLNTIFLRHVELVDMTASEAESAFIQLASRQGRYGQDVFPAEHIAAKTSVLVGAGVHGVSLFHTDQGAVQPAETYRWASLGNVRFRRKNFLLTLAQQDSSRKSPVVTFRLASRSQAKALWKTAVRQHTFFRQRRGVTKHEHSLLQSMLNRRTPLERSGFFGMTEIETTRNAEKSVRANRTFSRLDETPLSLGRAARMQAFLPDDSPYRAGSAAAAAAASSSPPYSGNERGSSPTWDTVHEAFDPKEAFMRMDSFQGDTILTETKFIDSLPHTQNASSMKRQAPAPPVRTTVPIPRRATDEELDALPPPPPPDTDLEMAAVEGHSETFGHEYQPTLSPIRPLVSSSSSQAPNAAATRQASAVASSTPMAAAAAAASRATTRESRGPPPAPPPRGDAKNVDSAEQPQAPPSPALALAAIAAALPGQGKQQKPPSQQKPSQQAVPLLPLSLKQGEPMKHSAAEVLTETSFMAEPMLADGQLDASLVELQPIVAEESVLASVDRRSSVSRLSAHVVSPLGPHVSATPMALAALREDEIEPVPLDGAEAMLIAPLQIEETSIDHLAPLQRANVSSSALLARTAKDIEGPVVGAVSPAPVVLTSTTLTATREVIVPTTGAGSRTAPPPPTRTTPLQTNLLAPTSTLSSGESAANQHPTASNSVFASVSSFSATQSLVPSAAKHTNAAHGTESSNTYPSITSTMSAPPALSTTIDHSAATRYSAAAPIAANVSTPSTAVSVAGPSQGATTSAHPQAPFYARAMHREEGDTQRGLLAVERHDILHILDCSDPHWWHAENTSSGRKGLVPSATAMRSRAAAAAAAASDSEVAKSGSNTSLNLPSEMVPYKYITMYRPTPEDLRPVVILGPSKDHVIDRLVLDYPDVFHTCVPHTTRPRLPEEEHGLDYFFVSVEDMETSIARNEFAETLRFQNHLYGTSFKAIRIASENGGYCVLDVSDPQTIVNLENEGMYPIAIFLHPASPSSVLAQNPHLSPEAAAIVVAKAGELEHANRGLYSAIIENDQFENTYYKVYHAILAEARKAVWQEIKTDDNALSAPQTLIRMLRRSSATSPDAVPSTGSSAPASQQTSQQALRVAAPLFENPNMHASNAAIAVANVERAEAEGRHPQDSDDQNGDVTTGVKVVRKRSNRKSFVGTETIRFEKLATGLGFSFTGGVDTPTAPGDPGIYVTRVAPGGAAELDGRLQAGDKIVEANDVSFASITHQAAQEVLRHCTAVKLKVTRRCRRIRLVADNGVFGLGIKGGADAGAPVVISRIADNSPAARHPRLELGYEITHVNDVAVRDLTHEQVLDLIRSSHEELTLIVHPRRSRSFRHVSSSTTAAAAAAVAAVAARDLAPAQASSLAPALPSSPTADLANNPFFSAALATSQPLRATASPSPKNSPSSRARSPSREDSPGTARAQSPPARPQSPLRPGERARSPSNKDSPLVALRAGSPSPDGSPAQRARSPPRDTARASSPLRRDARSPSPSQDSPQVRARSPLRTSETLPIALPPPPVPPPVPRVLSPTGPAPTSGSARIYAPAPTVAVATARATAATTNGRAQLAHQSAETMQTNGRHAASTASGLPFEPVGNGSNPFSDEDGDTLDALPLRATSSQVQARRRETVGSLSAEDNRHIRGGGKFAELITSRPGYFREVGSKIALLPVNAPRNRYKDILPYDDNRVLLQAENDYINASPVHFNGGDFRLNYIATQGPKDVTAGHFWQMVEENNVAVICMLTTLHEGGRPKCFQYWPDAVGHEQLFGQHMVHFDAEERDPSGAFVVRMFTLQSPTCLRTVHHIQFTDWPDHGVPDASEHFLSYVERVQQLKVAAPPNAAPVVVHCSAGIGRTGVFIVLEIACALFERNRGVDLVEVIRSLRAQRMGLVQTEGQYQFVYKILAAMRRDQLSTISIVTTE